MDKLYEWKRFWHRIYFSEDESNDKDYYIDENGYLIDPDGSSFLTEKQDIHPLEAFDSHKCLVLLGEPGMGKSTEIHRYIQTYENKVNHKIKLIQLKAITAEYYNFNEAFKNDPIVEEWISDESELTLILDSFDEGELFTQNLEFALHTIISKLPFSRLRLLITCRKTIWPTSLSSKLEQLFSTDEILHIELTPLRKIDISIALKQEGIPIDPFFSQIEDMNVSFFATNPTTLDFLINKYKSDGKISGNKYEIFLDGCQQLCTELNETYGKKGFELNIQERMIIAGKISFLYIFSDKKGIVENNAQKNDNYLSFADIGKTENEEVFKNLHLSNSIIKEVLNTSLFTRRNDEYSFTTKSYAEFLAAWYIFENNIPIKQLKGLFSHPFNSKLIPQLHEVAAWISCKNEDFFDFCLEKEPIILLNSDLVFFNTEQKKRLLSALITQFDKTKYIPSDLLFDRKIKNLAYPNIEKDISETLMDKSKDQRLRLFIIQLIKYCQLVVLEDRLHDIAFDQDDHYLRVRAADAISEISSSIESKEKLLDLINDDDFDDDFRGIALFANWKTNLTSNNFFELLTPPKQDNYYGQYKGFLHHFESQIFNNNNISDQFILEGYNWIFHNHILRKQSAIHLEIIEEFMFESWNRLSNKDILDKLSKIILIKLERYGYLFENYQIISNPKHKDFIRNYEVSKSKRRNLLFQMLLNIKNTRNANILIYTSPTLILKQDFTWYLSLLEEKNEKFDIPDEIIHVLIFHTWMRDNLDQTFTLLKTSINDSNFRKFFPLRQIIKLFFKDKIKNNITIKHNSHQLNLIKQIKLSENHNPNTWTTIDEHIISDNQSIVISNQKKEYDLTQYNNWNLLQQEEKVDLIEAAEKYFSSINFEKYHYDSAFLFRLFYLLYIKKKIAINTLSTKELKNWIKVIIKVPFRYYLIEQNDININNLFSDLSDESNSFINEYIQNHIKPNSSFLDDNILHNLRFIWNKSNEITLTNCIIDLETNHNILPQLLYTLFQNNEDSAEQYCQNELKVINPNDLKNLQRKIIFARIYLFNQINGAWKVVWPIINKFPEFGRALFLSISTSIKWGNNNIFDELPSKELSNLFCWLMDNFPQNEDPKIIGVHAITPREDLSTFRDWIPKHFSEITDGASLEELKSLNKRFPDNIAINYYFHNADEIFRKNTWQPPTIDQLLDMLSSSKRYIQNPEQLVELILDSLEKLQTEVKGDTSPVNFLWNEWKDNKSKEIRYSPKEENRLSDYVKIYLQKEIISHGIIVNREVEVKPKTGDAPGQNIDIQVNAINLEEQNEENKIISVTIEVKGCWNNEIKTSMENQLLKRYLTDNNTDHGIYLIGWYKSNRWDTEDYRNKKCLNATLERTRKKFDNQAKSLSTSDKHLYSFVLDLSLPSTTEQ